MEATASTKRTLFDIGADFMALDALLDETGGEITPEVEATITAWQTEFQNGQAAKAEGWCQWMALLKTRAAAAKEQAELFLKKSQSYERQEQAMKDRMKVYMENTGQPKIVTSAGRTIAIQKNGGVAPLDLDSIDPKELPTEYQKVTVTANTDAIRDDLKNGVELPFARLKPVGTHLRIRV